MQDSPDVKVSWRKSVSANIRGKSFGTKVSGEKGFGEQTLVSRCLKRLTQLLGFKTCLISASGGSSQDSKDYAVKLIRSNAMMRRAADKEAALIQDVDPWAPWTPFRRWDLHKKLESFESNKLKAPRESDDFG